MRAESTTAALNAEDVPIIIIIAIDISNSNQYVYFPRQNRAVNRANPNYCWARSQRVETCSARAHLLEKMSGTTGAPLRSHSILAVNCNA